MESCTYRRCPKMALPEEEEEEEEEEELHASAAAVVLRTMLPVER